MNTNHYLKEQSTVFDLAKWPMMVLVVFIHTLSNVIHPIPLPLSLSELGHSAINKRGYLSVYQ